MLEARSIGWIGAYLIESLLSPLQKQVYFLLKTSIFTSIRGGNSFGTLSLKE